jgi:2-polyprenyl-3-methyl-5-hydroxy-6-metoxy-1,4-benzoquinol methylase
MSTTEAERQHDSYALGRTPLEHERLRAQARVWEAATGRLLDQAGLAPGARCLDAGCGPGETMSVMAQRTGPAGRVLGIDTDGVLGAAALAMLHRAGHRNCAFLAHDLTAGGPVPGGPFGVVYARLLLFHLPQRVAVLARLWDAVAPGGHLIVQDYDIRSADVLPPLDSVGELLRVITGAFTAAGCDVHAGARLAQLFAQAGIGTPDGTDVAGRIEPLASGRTLFEGTFRSVLPTALAHGITTRRKADAALAAIDRDAIRHADRPVLWPLLIGAWKRKAKE